MMSLRPVYGHQALRARLATAVRTGSLPASLLLTGPRGVGKQRLALWLGQRLLCDGAASASSTEPCGTCSHCRYTTRLQHPDLHWFFPRPKPKDKDPSPDEVRQDLADTIADRLAADGLWEGSTGMEGLYIATTRALIHAASLRPAMAPRAVFVVGDAERMISQEGSDQAANAFLKLLEEPPPGTTIILTSSEPGALLPTIRSRVVTVRVAPLSPDDVASFLNDPAVAARLGDGARGGEAPITRAAGAPGRLLEGESSTASFASARRLLEAALAPRTSDGDALRALAAAAQGVSKSRGAFADTLDALTVLLHARTRESAERGDERHARHLATAVSVLEAAKVHTQHNVTPMLLSAVLLDDLASLLATNA
jgi:DNA polymerase III subunit delta'